MDHKAFHLHYLAECQATFKRRDSLVGVTLAQGWATVIRVGAAACRDAQGIHPPGRWLVNHVMKASKFIGSVNVKVSSDEC